jgi:hypothetical protein
MIEIISYWFFIWFLLFIFGFTKANPYFILVISYIITLYGVFYLKYKKANNYNLLKFFIINIIIKLIPIIILICTNQHKFNYYDLYFLLNILILYIFVIYIFNKNPINTYKRMYYSYINNKSKSFVSKFYDNIYKFLYSYYICL